MKLSLIVKVGSNSKRFDFDQTLCVIGRKDADVLLSDRRCSRNHAVLYESEQGNLHIKDLNSSNGTFFNDAKITDQSLDQGDVFKIGDCEIRIEEFVPNSTATFVGNVKDILKRPIPIEVTSKGISLDDLEKKKKAS